jgi:paraquat-inducible protein A
MLVPGQWSPMSTEVKPVITESANTALADASLIACPSCDLVQRLPEITPGPSARCPRCQTELRRGRKDSLNRTLALASAAAVFYLIANTLPMLGLTAAGHASSTTVIGGALKLWGDGEEAVAALVFFAAVLAPALQISFLLTVLIAAQLEHPPAWIGTVLRYHPFTSTWSMIEVMLLGVLVALTKISEYATVIPGRAIFALGGLVVLFAAMQSSFDPQEIWKRIEWNATGTQPRATGNR